jgi:tRNA-dihydrouridine synthase
LTKKAQYSRTIPIIANGDCFKYEDAQEIRRVTGADAVMVARGAEANPSCFSPDGLRNTEDVMKDYVRLVRSSSTLCEIPLSDVQPASVG